MKGWLILFVASFAAFYIGAKNPSLLARIPFIGG